jgi:DNA-binding IclR family transcriptional regulator
MESARVIHALAELLEAGFVRFDKERYTYVLTPDGGQIAVQSMAKC